jgi:hypothetical protein
MISVPSFPSPRSLIILTFVIISANAIPATDAQPQHWSPHSHPKLESRNSCGITGGKSCNTVIPDSAIETPGLLRRTLTLEQRSPNPFEPPRVCGGVGGPSCNFVGSETIARRNPIPIPFQPPEVCGERGGISCNVGVTGTQIGDEPSVTLSPMLPTGIEKRAQKGCGLRGGPSCNEFTSISLSPSAPSADARIPPSLQKRKETCGGQGKISCNEASSFSFSFSTATSTTTTTTTSRTISHPPTQTACGGAGGPSCNTSSTSPSASSVAPTASSAPCPKNPRGARLPPCGVKKRQWTCGQAGGPSCNEDGGGVGAQGTDWDGRR